MSASGCDRGAEIKSQNDTKCIDDQRTVRLFCLPHAGGSAASFRDWKALLSNHVEVHAVELPGRCARFRETAIARMDDLIRHLLRELESTMRPPLAIYGHSMGASIAYALARALRFEKTVSPMCLFVSGCAAPHLRYPMWLHRLSDKELLRQVARMNDQVSISPNTQELLTLMLPTLRADICLHETFLPPREPRLDIPIAAFGGLADPFISAAQLAGWRDLTSGPFGVYWYPGNHHLDEGSVRVLAARIGKILSERSPAENMRSAL